MGNDPTNSIKTFEKHPSIRKIQGYMHLDSIFNLDNVTKEKVEKETKLSNESKASPEKDSLVKKNVQWDSSENFSHAIDSCIWQIH